MRRALVGAAMMLTISAGAVPAQELENGDFTAKINGAEIHYVVAGSGPVCMVMPMAWGMSHEGLRGIFKPLEEYLTLVHFDPRGHGGSSPVGSDWERSMATLRADFDALREHLGLEKTIVMGISSGGVSSLYYAGEHPEAVDKLIILHCTAYTAPEDVPAILERRPEIANVFGSLSRIASYDGDKDARLGELIIEEYFPLLLADAEKSHAKMKEALSKAQFCYAQMSYNQTVDGPKIDAREAMKAITAPTLVVAGEHDLLPPASVEEIHKAIAGSVFMVFENSGHFSPVEEPEEFVRVVREFIGRAEK